MMWIPIALGILTFLHLYDYFVLRKVPAKWRIPAYSLTLAVALPWPWLSPPHPFLRFCLAGVVFNKLIKSAEIAWGRVQDPAMLVSFFRYLIWSANFPDTFWPKGEEDKKAARKDGLKKLFRGHLKFLLGGGIFLLSTLFPSMHDYYYLTMFWLMLLAYLIFSGLTDIIVGYHMQVGIRFSELFNSPFLATSPRDFWGKRWNLYFRDVTHRNIFIPCGGKKRPFIAVFLVFSASAIMHEYMIFAAVGLAWIGWMSAFFLLHCFSTMADFVVSKKRNRQPLVPAVVGILLHTSWLLLTVPLLMEPLLAFIPFLTWRLW